MGSTRTVARSATALALLIVVASASPTFPAGAATTAETAKGNVYVALGDSLAASFQPNGDRHSGYAEQILQLEQLSIPDLRLVKLGCPGERTNTIDRTRRACPYAEGTQLDQAVSVLQTRDVAFLTLQI